MTKRKVSGEENVLFVEQIEHASPFHSPANFKDIGCGQNTWSTIYLSIYFMLVILWAPPLAIGNERSGASCPVTFEWTPNLSLGYLWHISWGLPLQKRNLDMVSIVKL